jgi:ribonuclease P protein subunit RPR2
MKKRSRKGRIEDIALQRIERLFELAEADAKENKIKGRSRRSDRYVQLARKIGMRYRVQIPHHLKMRICKGCYAFLVPGENARVRLRGDYITTTCLKCGKQMRRPYKFHRRAHGERRGTRKD